MGKAPTETSAFTRPADADDLVDLAEALAIAELNVAQLDHWTRQGVFPAPVLRGLWGYSRTGKKKYTPYLQFNRRAVETAAANIRRIVAGGFLAGMESRGSSTSRDGLLEGTAEGSAD